MDIDLDGLEARMVLLPGTTDLYFRVADHSAERAHLANGVLKPIDSVWGHRAGNPNPKLLPAEFAYVKAIVREELAKG